MAQHLERHEKSQSIAALAKLCKAMLSSNKLYNSHKCATNLVYAIDDALPLHWSRLLYAVRIV